MSVTPQSKGEEAAERGYVLCPECGARCPSMDHYVDHLADDHDAFSWVAEGRPLADPVEGKEAELEARGHVSCEVCNQRCASMDHYTDHLADAHDAFSWVVEGRPVEFGGGD